MAKYHIKKDGTPGVCHAEKGKCPLGGATGLENHFDTQAEAQAVADKMHANEFKKTNKVGPAKVSEKEKEDLIRSYPDRVKKFTRKQQFNHKAPKSKTDPKEHMIDEGYSEYEQNVDNEEDIDRREDLDKPIKLSNGETYTAVQYSFINGTGQPTLTLMKDKTNLSAGYLELYPKHDYRKRQRDEVVFDRAQLGKDTDKIIDAVNIDGAKVDNSDEAYPTFKQAGLTKDLFTDANMSDEAIDNFENEYDFDSSFDEDEREQLEDPEGYAKRKNAEYDRERKDLEQEYNKTR